jgi:hypothetical protein
MEILKIIAWIIETTITGMQDVWELNNFILIGFVIGAFVLILSGNNYKETFKEYPPGKPGEEIAKDKAYENLKAGRIFAVVCVVFGLVIEGLKLIPTNIALTGFGVIVGGVLIYFLFKFLKFVFTGLFGAFASKPKK